jgi:hypothetical protein
VHLKHLFAVPVCHQHYYNIHILRDIPIKINLQEKSTEILGATHPAKLANLQTILAEMPCFSPSVADGPILLKPQIPLHNLKQSNELHQDAMIILGINSFFKEY